MRFVAIATAVLVLPLLPLVEANDFDECSGLTANKPCHKVELPADPPAQSGHGRKYYVYGAALRCPVERPQDTACAGRPNPHSTLPGGGALGVVYEETNKYPGLQRFRIVLPDETVIPPDTMILY